MKLADYSAVIVSISGGKDSQACMDLIHQLAVEQQYSERIYAVHADTGAEWPESLPHCRYLCEAYGFDLHVAVPFRKLPDHIERRCRILQEQGKAGGWPSAACRYCTSDCKRTPIHKVLRGLFSAKDKHDVLMITGERREESKHRATLSAVQDVKRLAAGCRKVVNWRPILDYKLADVWDTIEASGFPRHIAYDLGNERLSCGICVLACKNDILNGAEHMPELAERYMAIERETGHSFRHGKTLAEILQEAHQ